MSRVTAFLWRILGGTLERRDLGMLASTCYQKAIESSLHTDAESHYRLGRLLVIEKRWKESLPLLRQAISIEAGNHLYWNTLGVAQRESGKADVAVDSFRRALALNPRSCHAQNNLGNWYLAHGNPELAMECFKAALDVDPSFYEALNNRIVALLDLGKNEEAEKFAKEALVRYPDSAPLHLNLGNSYLQQGKAFLALQSYRKALALEPEFEEAHFNHALLDGTADHLRQAVNYLKKKIEEKGRSLDLLNRLAIAQMANLQYGEAEAACREMIKKQPAFAAAYVTLGNIVSINGDAQQALECYETALQYRPGDVFVHSNVLFEMNYLADRGPAEVFKRHLQWAEEQERPLFDPSKKFSNSRDKGRRIRIGYVSPDFHTHPVGHLTKGVIKSHNKTEFEVHCYSRVAKPDHVTRDLEQAVDFWHDTLGVADVAVAEQIEEDGIDILVDLTGHTAGHRLLAFARKPAPIQATWVGYFHSTGMASIDYFISDPYTSPKGSGQFFSETPVWLPNTRFCYTPPDEVPPVVEPPYLKNGFVTYGCFNKLSKMTGRVIDTWAQILLRAPGARLWLKSYPLCEPDVRDHVLKEFASRGVAPERIILKPSSNHAEMLKEYGEIDICLDPFPFTGGMTTFEALLMGVPIITLALQPVVSRQTASALSNLGLNDLIHETIEDYIQGAVALAADKNRLAEIRRTIRPAMERSPLRDVEGFTRDLENLYRRMWHAWCDATKLKSDIA